MDHLKWFHWSSDAFSSVFRLEIQSNCVQIVAQFHMRATVCFGECSNASDPGILVTVTPPDNDSTSSQIGIKAGKVVSIVPGSMVTFARIDPAVESNVVLTSYFHIDASSFSQPGRNCTNNNNNNTESLTVNQDTAEGEASSSQQVGHCTNNNNNTDSLTVNQETAHDESSSSQPATHDIINNNNNIVNTNNESRQEHGVFSQPIAVGLNPEIVIKRSPKLINMLIQGPAIAQYQVYLYHEKQKKAKCGLHTVNNLLQKQKYVTEDFDEVQHNNSLCFSFFFALFRCLLQILSSLSFFFPI